MDISSIAATATSMAQQSTDNAVSTAVLTKALDMQSSAAMQLIAALPQPALAAEPVRPSY